MFAHSCIGRFAFMLYSTLSEIRCIRCVLLPGRPVREFSFLLCEPPAHGRQRLTCEPPAPVQPNHCLCFQWHAPVGISVSGAVRRTYTNTLATMEPASGAPSPAGALEAVPVVVAAAPLAVGMDMEGVTPLVSRRRLRDHDVSPSSHSTASTTARSAASPCSAVGRGPAECGAFGGVARILAYLSGDARGPRECCGSSLLLCLSAHVPNVVEYARTRG